MPLILKAFFDKGEWIYVPKDMYRIIHISIVNNNKIT